jgi:hypothetical protein
MQVNFMSEKQVTLSMKVDLQTMSEFAVAVDIIGAKSINSMLLMMIKQKIRESKTMVDDAEFLQMVERQKQKTLELSAKKSAERQMLGELEPKSDKTIPVLQNSTEKRKRG